ncbi:MAG: hypothetical protein R3E53_07375 [Myxococcota bacterium]
MLVLLPRGASKYDVGDWNTLGMRGTCARRRAVGEAKGLDGESC